MRAAREPLTARGQRALAEVWGRLCPCGAPARQAPQGPQPLLLTPPLPPPPVIALDAPQPRACPPPIGPHSVPGGRAGYGHGEPRSPEAAGATGAGTVARAIACPHAAHSVRAGKVCLGTETSWARPASESPRCSRPSSVPDGHPGVLGTWSPAQAAYGPAAGVSPGSGACPRGSPLRTPGGPHAGEDDLAINPGRLSPTAAPVQSPPPPKPPPTPEKVSPRAPPRSESSPSAGRRPLRCPVVVGPSKSLAEEKWCLAHSADEETEAASHRETCTSCAPPGGPRRAVPSPRNPQPHVSCRGLQFSGTPLISPIRRHPISSETSTHVALYTFSGDCYFLSPFLS